ncbi:MAG: MBL fold metallo-hydrolase, partial [Verrucomicrobia bacterium]
MKIHHLRNATFVIESGEHHILIDPMLSEKGALPPFSYFRAKPLKNPIVNLPDNADEVLGKVTHCLITHSQKLGIKALQHTDHLDQPGENFLRGKNIPVITLAKDSGVLKKGGLNIATELEFWQLKPVLGGEITAVPAQH